MEASEFIGLDVGKVRTGMARGSSIAKLAQPLKTLPTEQVIAELKTHEGLAGIVVGLPRSLDGSETDQTAWVRQWVDAAQKQLSAPFYWQDEALTSKLAEAKHFNKARIKDVDSLAAQIILQDFLDSPQSLWVIC